MWGYSLEDLAKKAQEAAAAAQEEAAKLAEQAVEQASTFNLDAMNPDADQSAGADSGYFTPQASPVPPTAPARQIQTEPAAKSAQSEGNADHLSSLVSKAPSSPERQPAVTKLSMNTEEEGDFFEGWGEDDLDLNDGANNRQEKQPAADDSDVAAERLREESQKEAERIVKEEDAEKKKRGEEERLANEQAEAERLEKERAEQERLAAEKAEAERLKQERLASEEAAKEAEEKARQEAERLEQEKLELEREKEEAERLAAEQAEKERIEQERLEEERLEAERAEAERLEQERLAAEESVRLEAEEAAKREAERLEQDRLAAEEAARLEAEEAVRVEAERMERERIEAEEAARQAEEERLAAEEYARAEAERIAAEEEAARQAEAEEAEAARLEAEQLEREKLAEEAERAEFERLERESLEAEAKRLEQEKLAAESAESVNPETQPGSAEGEWDGEDEIGDLDDMYDDDSDEDEPDSAPEESTPNDQMVEDAEPPPESDAPPAEKPAVEEDNAEEGGQPAAAASEEAGFFDAAAAVTQASTSLSSMFDASASTSMFSWGYGESEEAPAHGEAAPGAKPAMEPIKENETAKEVVDSQAESIDGQDVKGGTSEQIPSQTVVNEAGSDRPVNNNDGVPQHTLDHFMGQLERMTESHQLEMDELNRVHKIEIDRLEGDLQTEREKKKKTSARDEVASQDKFLKQMRQLEKKFAGTIKEKEDELEDVMKRNEGMGLKMDTLKREVEGLTKIVDERDEEIMKLKQGHGTSLMQVEGQVKTSQDELMRKDNEISELKSSVSALQTDLDTTSEAYDTLKARAKAVATELKDRRIEVRTLTAQNEELSSSTGTFETQLANLRAIVNQHELTITYKDNDMEALSEKVKELNKQIERGTAKSVQDRSVGEAAIASYKRKAQEALAAANSRLAAANQAREEAEIDAKNAKSASDDALERARVAEAKKSEAEQKANEASTLLETEREASSTEVGDLKETLEGLRDTVNSLQSEAEEASTTRAKLTAELENLNSDLLEQKEKNSELREQLIESNTLCESLQREVSDLTDEVQRSSAVAFKRAKDSGEGTSAENPDRNGSSRLSASGNEAPGDRQESDGTIIMLQQELHGANEAIAELKLALRTALLEKADSNHTARRESEASALTHESHGADPSDSQNGNETTPLFFAIEKQNELKTARDEINRLANMLGDAESAKQEAYDAVEDMRQSMEEANARLLRYEKLGMKSTGRPAVAQSSYGPFRGNASGHSGVLSDDATRMANSGNDNVVNLEYLKNILLSFLTADTLADRRKLVPVVATVLCLTPEEQAQAISAVEQSAGLTGVASSFWENIGSKAHNLM